MSVCTSVLSANVAVPVPSVSNVSVVSIASTPDRLYSTRTVHFGKSILQLNWLFSQWLMLISNGNCRSLQLVGSSAFTSPYSASSILRTVSSVSVVVMLNAFSLLPARARFCGALLPIPIVPSTLWLLLVSTSRVVLTPSRALLLSFRLRS